jgi:hypothetical protein
MNDKKFNRQATVEEILKVAHSITNRQKFDELMQDDEFVKESAELWGVELVYD